MLCKGCFYNDFLKQAPLLKYIRPDPEGGHMFIEEFILMFFRPRGWSYVKFSNTFDRLRGRFVGNIQYYKHVTTFGVEIQNILTGQY